MIKKLLILPMFILAFGKSYAVNGTQPDSARVIVGSFVVRTINVLANDNLVAGKNYQLLSVFKSVSSPNVTLAIVGNNATYKDDQVSTTTDTFFYVAKDLVVGDNDTNFVIIRKTNLNLDQFPGDATKDNICNNIDVLSIGIGFNKTDQVREGNYLTDNWVAIRAYDWLLSSTKSNYRFADANGDGLIDSAGDVATIHKNYNQISGANLVAYSPTGGPSFELIPSVDTVKFSTNTTTIPLQIKLGSSSNSVSGAYGIAFTIKYDTSIFKANQLTFNPKKWFADQQATLNFSKTTQASGELDVTIVRKNGKNDGGGGELGVVDVVVIDILGKFENTHKANFEIIKAVLIDSAYNLKPVTLAVKPLYIKKLTNSITTTSKEKTFNGYNIGHNKIKLDNHLAKIQHFEIFNLLGKKIYQDSINGSESKTIDVSLWSSGIYFIKSNQFVIKISIDNQ